MDKNIDLFLNELRLQDDDGWNWSGMILLSLQGLVSESEVSLLQSLIVAFLTLNMLLVSGDVLHCEGWLSTGTGAQRGCGVSILEALQKASGQRPRQLALGGTDWAGRLDKMTAGGAFQPQPYCDCPHTFPVVVETVEKT